MHTESVLRTGTSAIGYAFIPIVSALAIAFFALVLRWATAPSKRVQRANFGLLVELARFKDAGDAERLAHRLRTKGIKASTGKDIGQHCVLVWRVQEPLAKILVREFGEDSR